MKRTPTTWADVKQKLLAVAEYILVCGFEWFVISIAVFMFCALCWAVWQS